MTWRPRRPGVELPDRSRGNSGAGRRAATRHIADAARYDSPLAVYRSRVPATRSNENEQ